MAYLLDSDCVIDHLDGVAGSTAYLQGLTPSGIAVSMVTYMEVCELPVGHSDAAGRQTRLNAFLGAVPVLDFSRQVAERCARLRMTIRAQGGATRNRALDLIVASTALEHGLTMITYNVADYADIHGLQLQETTYRP